VARCSSASRHERFLLTWNRSWIQCAISRRRDGFKSFFNHLLQDVPIERQIGYHTLEPGVLIPELAQFTQF
jgi:hypothetical protein